MVRYDTPVEPEEKLHNLYEEAYSIYRGAGDSLAPVSHRMAVLQERKAPA